jgi:elongation factor P
MILASDLRTGMCIRIGEDIYKVLAAEFKVGTAKLPSSMHARLRNLRTGSLTDQRLHPEAKVDNISVEAVSMEYSYTDGDMLYFMHPTTFDQVGVPRRMVGNYEKFLESGAMLKVEYFGEEPIDVQVPRTVDVAVVSTGAPMHGDIDAAPKTATVTNGLEVQVPQFIKVGDHIRIEVEGGKYIERIR